MKRDSIIGGLIGAAFLGTLLVARAYADGGYTPPPTPVGGVPIACAGPALTGTYPNCSLAPASLDSMLSLNSDSNGNVILSLPSGKNLTAGLNSVFMTVANTQTAINNAVSELQNSSQVQNAISNAISPFQSAAQVQAIVNNSIVGLQNATQVQSSISSAISGLQNATQVQALITSGISGLQTASQVQSLISSAISALSLSTTYYPSTNPNGYITSADNLRLAGGPFTVNPATIPQNPLPSCNYANAGKVAYVTDLGGGPSNVVCRNATSSTNGNWGYASNLGIAAVNSTCGNITITPLISAPIQKLTCTSFTSTNTINVVNPTQYPGYQFQLIAPSSLGTLLTSIGITAGSVASGVTLTNGSKSVYSILSDGTLLQTQ